MPFSALKLHPSLERGLKDLGYRLEVGINVLYDEDFMIFQLPTSAATVRAASR